MKFRSKTFATFAVLAMAYAAINLLATPPRTTLQHYHVSSTTLHVLDSTIIFPIIAIWFIGLYGYQRLRSYSARIGTNKDGVFVLGLTRGIMLLAFWLPVSSTLSSILSTLGKHDHALLPAVTVCVNYLSLLFPLIAFLLISRSARGLSELAKQRPSHTGTHTIALVLIVAGVLYGYLVSNARGSIDTIYHLPLVVVLLTIVVPYIFSWYLGLLGAYEILLYTKKVQGIIYRKSWSSLAFGCIWLIVMSIVLQYLTAVSAKLSNLSLGWILALIYSIIPVMAVGYIFVAKGAKRLIKIEEV